MATPSKNFTDPTGLLRMGPAISRGVRIPVLAFTQQKSLIPIMTLKEDPMILGHMRMMSLINRPILNRFAMMGRMKFASFPPIYRTPDYEEPTTPDGGEMALDYYTDIVNLRKGLESWTAYEAQPYSHPVLATWERDRGDPIPFTVVTGPMDMGNPGVTKFFDKVAFYGNGTVHVMAFVDNVLVQTGHAAMAETPNRQRFLNLPKGSKGYELNLVMLVNGYIDTLDIHWDPVSVETESSQSVSG